MNGENESPKHCICIFKKRYWRNNKFQGKNCSFYCVLILLFLHSFVFWQKISKINLIVRSHDSDLCIFRLPMVKMAQLHHVRKYFLPFFFFSFDFDRSLERRQLVRLAVGMHAGSSECNRNPNKCQEIKFTEIA